jgi:hypothetical protein
MNWQKKHPAREHAGPRASSEILGFLPSWWSRDWLLGVFLAAVTLIAYLPVCHAGFIWNDDEFVTENPVLKSADGLARLWHSRAADDFVPATMTCLWLEWRLWGENPLGYHLDSVLLHLGSALLLWRILLRLKIPGAWLAAALFALHPVNVESVAWITQRKNTLTMLLFLTTVQWYLLFEDLRRRCWFWLAAGMFLLALMGKTAVVPLRSCCWVWLGGGGGASTAMTSGITWFLLHWQRPDHFWPFGFSGARPLA